jgi:tRNA (cmo5U34)-methyltransferase
MLKKAKLKCEEFENVVYINEDINNFIFPQSNLIISVYTLQFINKNNRQDIINKIYDSLEKGGAFILCEKIIIDNEFIANSYVKFHHDLKKRNKISNDKIIEKENSLINVMYPITYEENCHIIQRSGFSTIQTFFQWYNFICIIAIKD